MGTGVLVGHGVSEGFGILVGRSPPDGSDVGGDVLVGNDVAIGPSPSVGATIAASVIGGRGGCVLVGVAVTDEAQPASTRQTMMMGSCASLSVLM